MMEYKRGTKLVAIKECYAEIDEYIEDDRPYKSKIIYVCTKCGKFKKINL